MATATTQELEQMKEGMKQMAARFGAKRMTSAECITSFHEANTNLKKNFETLAKTLDTDESLNDYLFLILRSQTTMMEHLNVLAADHREKK